MAKNFQGVMSKPSALSPGDLAELCEPHEYDKKLDILRATLPNYEKWYQEIVNLPARKWRAAIDEKLSELYEANSRIINFQPGE